MMNLAGMCIHPGIQQLIHVMCINKLITLDNILYKTHTLLRVIPTGTVCCHSFWHLIWKYIWPIIWHIFPDIIVWHSIWHYLTFYSDILFWQYIWHLFNLFWHPFWPILTLSLTWALPSEIRRSRLSKEDVKEKVPLTKLETLTWQVGEKQIGFPSRTHI